MFKTNVKFHPFARKGLRTEQRLTFIDQGRFLRRQEREGGSGQRGEWMWWVAMVCVGIRKIRDSHSMAGEVRGDLLAERRLQGGP